MQNFDLFLWSLLSKSFQDIDFECSKTSLATSAIYLELFMCREGLRNLSQQLTTDIVMTRNLPCILDFVSLCGRHAATVKFEQLPLNSKSITIYFNSLLSMQSYIAIKIIQKILGILPWKMTSSWQKLHLFTFTIQWQQTRLPVLYTEK